MLTPVMGGVGLALRATVALALLQTAELRLKAGPFDEDILAGPGEMEAGGEDVQQRQKPHPDDKKQGKAPIDDCNPTREGGAVDPMANEEHDTQ